MEKGTYRPAFPCGGRALVRDVEAAFRISQKMTEMHKLPALSDDAVCQLGRRLARLQRRKTIGLSLDAIPSDDRVWKELDKILKAMAVLRRYADPETLPDPTELPGQVLENPFDDARNSKPQTTPEAHARVLFDDRIRAFDELRDYIPLRRIFTDAARAYPLLNAEIDRQRKAGYAPGAFGQKVTRPKRRIATELAGRLLPELFTELYASASFGGTDSYTEEIKGPLYTFVVAAMSELGFACKAADVRNAMRTLRRDGLNVVLAPKNRVP